MVQTLVDSDISETQIVFAGEMPNLATMRDIAGQWR
jgi:hypothetical protein